VSTLEIDRLRDAFPGRLIEYHAVIDSTMRAAVGQPFGSVILAEEQTGGQGRHGRSWHSEPSSGIYVSMVLEPMPLLTLALGLAAAEAIASVTGIACDLRWPNDVMVCGKKAAGILVQLVNTTAIGGIGINMNHTSFPPELAEIATSLRLAAGRELSRTDLLLALIPAVESFAALNATEILRLFARASSYSAGRRVVIDQPDGVVEGVTSGLTQEGYLVVRKDDGTETLILAGGVRAASS
jgi:BirA family biotin operon repressor/biotin-[acetyl-CoA-carboxylase] ligase